MTTPSSDDDRDLALDDALRPMRAVWLSMRDEEPPAGGLAELLAAARAQAEVMRPQVPWWRKALAMMQRPPVLALATVMVLLGGAVLVGSRREQLEAVPAVEQRELARSGETAPAVPPPAEAERGAGGADGAGAGAPAKGMFEDRKPNAGSEAAVSGAGSAGASVVAEPPRGTVVPPVRDGGGGPSGPSRPSAPTGGPAGVVAGTKGAGAARTDGDADGAATGSMPLSPGADEQANGAPADLKKGNDAGRVPAPVEKLSPGAGAPPMDDANHGEKSKDTLAAERVPPRVQAPVPPPPPVMAPKSSPQSAGKPDLQIAEDAEAVVAGNEAQISSTQPRTRTVTTDSNRNGSSAANTRRASLEQLAKQAETAASRGDCAAARAIVDRIRKLDATFHKERVQSNATVKRCVK